MLLEVPSVCGVMAMPAVCMHMCLLLGGMKTLPEQFIYRAVGWSALSAFKPSSCNEQIHRSHTHVAVLVWDEGH